MSSQPDGPLNPWASHPPAPDTAPATVPPSPYSNPERRRHQSATYDLLVRGGTVLDPSQNLHAARDVAFAWGRVAAVIEPGAIEATQARLLIDATGKLVVPGLIDLHTHVYVGGAELALPADEACAAAGTTTAIDAGTASANNMLGFFRLARDPSQTSARLYAFVHISGLGLVAHPHGESRDLSYLEPELAAQCILRYPGFVLGVKVRQSGYIVGQHGLEPLRRAIRAAEMAREALAAQGAGERLVPVMVHIGGAPASIAELLALLRPGDIVTHCFTASGNGVLNADGRVEDACRRARDRGVSFDVGHGSGSLAEPVARAAVEQDFWPDTISTDLHTGSVTEKAIDLPTTMSKFLSFGLPLAAVVARATTGPARIVNTALPAQAREPLLGTLQPGAPGDAAILDHRQGTFRFVDAQLNAWTGSEALLPAQTILGGRPVGRPFPHPYLAP